MLYSPTINKAIKLMAEVHKNQTDKGGNPYCLHPFEVAERWLNITMKNSNDKILTPNLETGICVALLHDYLEDGGDYKELEKFPDEIKQTVDILTRKDGEIYRDYIERVAANPLACQIKLIDIQCNSNLCRIDNDNIRNQVAELIKSRYKPAEDALVHAMVRDAMARMADLDFLKSFY